MSYLLMAHFIACFFIILGNFEDDWKKTWVAKLPSPSVYFPDNSERYIKNIKYK